MTLVYGGPTTGKSTLAKELESQGLTTIDTDHMIEAFVAARIGSDITDHHAAWVYWKEDAKPEFKAEVQKDIEALVSKLRHVTKLDQVGRKLVIFTNLHWDGMKPDLAYFRETEDMVQMMKDRAEAKKQTISASYEAQIRTWKAPANIGTEVKILGKGEFIPITDIIPPNATDIATLRKARGAPEQLGSAEEDQDAPDETD